MVQCIPLIMSLFLNKDMESNAINSFSPKRYFFFLRCNLILFYYPFFAFCIILLLYQYIWAVKSKPQRTWTAFISSSIMITTNILSLSWCWLLSAGGKFSSFLIILNVKDILGKRNRMNNKTLSVQIVHDFL